MQKNRTSTLKNITKALLVAGGVGLLGGAYYHLDQAPAQKSAKSDFSEFASLFAPVEYNDILDQEGETKFLKYHRQHEQFQQWAKENKLIEKIENLTVLNADNLPDWYDLEQQLVKKVEEVTINLREIVMKDIDSEFIADTFYMVRRSRAQYDDLGLSFGDMINTLEQNCNKLLLVSQNMSALGLNMKIRSGDAIDVYEEFLEELEFAEADGEEELAGSAELLKDYFRSLLNILHVQNEAVRIAHSTFINIQEQMAHQSSLVKTQQGQAVNMVNDKVTQYRAEEKTFEREIDELTNQMKDHETIRLNLKPFVPEPTKKIQAQKCENKNQKCITLTSSSTTYHSGWHGCWGCWGWYGRYGHSTTSHSSRAHCWQIDECTKIIEERYKMEKKLAHELQIKTMELRHATEKENNRQKRELLEKRLAFTEKINAKREDLFKKQGKIIQWEWTMNSQEEYLKNLVNVMTAVYDTTTQATGNLGDIQQITDVAIESLDKRNGMKTTYAAMKNGKLRKGQQKVIEKLLEMKRSGDILREASLAQEKEYGKVVYQIQSDKKML